MKALAILGLLGLTRPLQHTTPRPPRGATTRRCAAEGTQEQCAVASLLAEAGASPAELEPLLPFAPLGGKTAVLEYLLSAGFTPPDVIEMLRGCPKLATKQADPVAAAATVEFLNATFGLRRYDLRKMLREEPSLLLLRKQPIATLDTGACPAILAAGAGYQAGEENTQNAAADASQLLESVGVRPKHVRELIIRWPQLLTLPLPQLLTATEALQALGFTDQKLSALMRAHPFLLAARATDIREAARVLTDELGVRKLDVVVRAYPRALLTSPEDLVKPIELLKKVARVTTDDVPLIIEAFPLVFGLDAADQVAPVLSFWLDDLQLRREDVPRICRAFPSLLGVEVSRMKKATAFLREIGVVNVGRFVSRLPPVLAYDVENDLRPKMAHLVTSALSVYDVVRFPAFFSYPLDEVIRPRTAFLDALGLPLTSFELKAIITPGDADFAKRVVGVDAKVYTEFKAAYLSPSKPSAEKPLFPRPGLSPGAAFPRLQAPTRPPEKPELSPPPERRQNPRRRRGGNSNRRRGPSGGPAFPRMNN